MKPGKAIGPDDIPNWVLKELSDILAPPLCAIMNSSLREAYVPDIWRSANVSSLPKSVPIKDIRKDVRPISLTPVMSKLMEHFPVKYLNEACPSEMVDASQYAGKGASPTHALLRILHPIYQATDNSRYFARELLVDFSKAFDHIHHETLLQKLSSNGAPPCVINWFAAFLRGRKQRVKMGSMTSEWKNINGGVPQGTLSGPPLFVHMVSDLHTTHPDTKFMDDTTVSEIGLKSAGSSLQDSANEICVWSEDNQLGINATKTKDMVISFGNAPANLAPIIINNTEIETVHDSKLLGVYIQDNLKWDIHVEYMNKKASKRLYYLRLLKRSGYPRHELVNTYQALARSVCEYAIPVWSTSLTVDNSYTLESIQRRALKIVAPELSYEEALSKFELPTLADRRDAECRKFFNAMKNPEHRLHDLLPPKRDIKYDLKDPIEYPLPKWKTKRYKNSFVPYCLYNYQ